jgi:hypothetical protein
MTIGITFIIGSNAYSQKIWTNSHCDTLGLIGDDFKKIGKYQEAYDAYKFYIESCAYLSNSWERFSFVGDMCAKKSNDPHRYEEYREWLKKVLYLSMDTTYYCVDADQIIRTFYTFNALGEHGFKEQLTVLYFLANTRRCPSATTYYDSLIIPGTWNALYSAWLDSVHDPNLTPFDSTLPSLDDLGLSILRGNPAEVKKFIESKFGQIIGNIHALKNPFSSETKIEFTSCEAVELHFEVFNMLGEKLYDGGNKIYDEGENHIILPGIGLPHGELFARFSASDGTVKTIKLQHRE